MEERTRIERRKRRRMRRVRRFVARLMLGLVLLFIVIVVGSGLVVSCSHMSLASPSQTTGKPAR